MDYIGIKCPVCEKPFTEQDDIVVCPDCGAPYHRHCYTEKGACIFTELHEKGENWAPPAAPAAPDVSSEIKDKECPECGVLNAHSAMFCNICGASLTGAPQQHRNSPYNVNSHHSASAEERHEPTYGQPDNFPPPMGGFPGFGTIPFAYDPMGGVDPAAQLAEDVTYGDASRLVQQNTGYYMSAFRMLTQFKHRKFNFAAFMFSGGWLLFRKQYKAGFLVTGIMFLLYIVQAALSNLGTTAVMMRALDAFGAVNRTDLTMMQISNYVAEYVADKPTEFLLFISPLICSLLMLTVMLIVGKLGNKLYMNHCIRTVQKIKREKTAENDISEAYLSLGGVNTAVAFTLMVCVMILQWIPMLF